MHVITVYASATFVIIELINNLAEPFNLPPNLLTIVVIVLAVGFPLAIMLSWLYDVTSGGVEKTRPIEELKKGEKTGVPNAWKIATYMSFVVILGLLTFNIIGGTKSLKAGDIQSLVVLPFDNFTGDDELENLVSGMHAMLVGDMGRIRKVTVVGGTTSNAYKNAGMTATEIADELNVDAVVEASVMCFGDSVCMQFRLVRTTGKEEQLWIADFKEDKSQMLNLNNQITKQIADEIMIELSPEEERFLAKSRTVDREAYDDFVRSYQYWDDLSPESLNKALEYLNLAVEKDPDFAPIYAGLALVWDGLAQLGFAEPDVAEPKIFENINKALELDPDFPTRHFVSGIIAVWTEWDWEKGEREFLKALELNPNDVMSRVYYAHLLWILKRYDEAHFHSQMAAELDPMNPLILGLSSNVDCHSNIQQAVEKSKKALEIDPEHFYAMAAFMDASYLNGDYKSTIEIELQFYPGLNDEARETIMAVFQDKGYVEAINTMLTYVEEYARTNHVGPFELGELYYKVGNLDRFIECLIKGYEMHDPMMPYITISVAGFDDIKDDPRIKAIVEEMNLPFTAPD